MKPVSKRQKISPHPQLNKHQSHSPTIYHIQQPPLSEQQLRRYSQFPTKQIFLQSKPLSRQSRLTHFKSQNPIIRKRSFTPTTSKQIHLAQSQFEIRYKKIEQILNKKNQTLHLQNQFLKEQIRKLYNRQCKYKNSLKKYKQQIKFLKIQNQIYQGRYLQLKEYITEVIGRMNLANQSNYTEMMESCSKDLVSKLKEELRDEGQGQRDNHKFTFHWNLQQQQQEQEGDNRFLHILDQQDQTDNNYWEKQINQHDEQNDLKQTRFVKQPLNKQKYFEQYINARQQQNELKPPVSYRGKGLPPLYPGNSPLSNYDSSNPSNQNSDCKTIDRIIKHNKLLQDTSQSNYPNIMNQQIQQLTDQSEALMYQLRKTGNQDKQIRKKIIRISQKIRQLRMDKDKQSNKFTSLQNIVPKQ